MSDDSDSQRFELSAAQARALAAVLDEVVPPNPNAGLAGAGGLGIGRAVAKALADSPEAQPPVLAGFAELDDLAAHRGVAAFADLPGAGKTDALNELASRETGFLPWLIFQAYLAYYQEGRVVEALGLEDRPPHPLGYELETGDLTLLDPVRARPRAYREV